jgi:hypothetical protein
MPASWRREEDRVDYVVVERDGVNGERGAVGIEIGNPTPTVRRRFRRSLARRQMPTPTDADSDDESDFEEDLDHALKGITSTAQPFTIPSATPSSLPAVRQIHKQEIVSVTDQTSSLHQMALPQEKVPRLRKPLCHL